MSTKLSRDTVLREILNTLIKGWGKKAVYDALDGIAGSAPLTTVRGQSSKPPDNEPKAVQIVDGMLISGDRKALLIDLARDFDAGTAFPRMSDVRAFLASHHRPAKDLRTRIQAFRAIVPLLIEMSEKGLMKVISRSKHSGPAELDAISDAIKGAGESIRGAKPGRDDDQA